MTLKINYTVLCHLAFQGSVCRRVREYKPAEQVKLHVIQHRNDKFLASFHGEIMVNTLIN